MTGINRRQFLGTTISALTAASSLGQANASNPATRPNIVVIMADDLGYSDIGCYGGEIATPNLDGLARDGLRFTQFYNAARCCPTRASLLTGLYPHQAGMGGMVSFPEQNRPQGPYQGYLNDRCVTVAEVLRGAGYRTYMSGKWHVGEAPEHWPRQRGFDRYYGLISGGSSYWELSSQGQRPRVMVIDDERHTPEPGNFYFTDAFSDSAARFIQDHPDTGQPFFLYLAYTAPHWPLHAWPEDIAKYKDQYDIGWDELRARRHKRMIELGVVDEKWPLSPRDPEVIAWEKEPDKANRALRMAVYAAMIDRMDQGIGRVLNALRAKGVEDNTLVLFLADNGGCHEMLQERPEHTPGKLPGEPGSFLSYERCWANASNTPFRMFKHWVHEGGIATPLIARWPSGIRDRGGITNQTGHVIDLMATACDLAGQSYPREFNGRPITPLEGKSLAPILAGRRRVSHDAIYWEHMGNKAMRQDDWKLVAPKDGPWELYNLETDRTELNNLIDRKPRRAKAMIARWEKWAQQCGVNTDS